MVDGIIIISLSIGCPVILRTDLGTENSMVSYLQPFLRRHCTGNTTIFTLTYNHRNFAETA